MGTITRVGYWTGPYGHIFPVFEWSEANTVELIQPYLDNNSSNPVDLTQPPLDFIKGTYYGDLYSKSLELYQSEKASNNTYYEQYDENTVAEQQVSSYSTGTSSVQSGTVNIFDYSTGEKGGYFLVNRFWSSYRGVVQNDYSILSDGGGRAGIILLKLDDDGELKIIRINGYIYLDGDIQNGLPISIKASINFRTLSTTSNDLSFLFGLDNQQITLDPHGKYTPGATPPPYNPYEPGGSSGEGGGGGNFDDDSDLIPDSSLPTLSSANTGFTRIYNPTLAQVQDLARYLWTDESVIETIWNHIKQYFENPMEAIIGFNLVPVPVPDGGTQNFALMYIDTGVSMTVAASQFVDVDCGTFELKPYYGSALDYAPYTKVSCFLPFIGVVQLNTDEVMNTTLQVKYRVDICSGSCVAKILVNGNVLYQYSGHCAINIPISAADFSSYVSAAISVAKLAIGAATGGAMGALESLFGDPSQQTNQVITRTTVSTQTERNPSTGRQITTGRQTVVETTERPQDTSSTQASYDGLSPANISNTVGQIMSSKPHVEHSGSFSGNTGYLGVRRPYLIIQRPNMCMPSNYQQLNGFPSMITMSLGECKGFTRVQQVQLTGSFATNPEQSEILQFLKSGVIL